MKANRRIESSGLKRIKHEFLNEFVQIFARDLLGLQILGLGAII